MTRIVYRLIEVVCNDHFVERSAVCKREGFMDYF